MKKRILWMLTAILLCGLTTTVFTSCGSDDDSSSAVEMYQYDITVHFVRSGLIGEVPAEGCQEVTSTLKEKYGKFLTGTEVTIKKQYMRTISVVDSYKF